MKIEEICALGIYFAALLAIGLYFFFRDSKKGGMGEKDYFLGGRNMNGWVSALSAGASDMSAWVLMGLPGAIYLYGVGQIWIAVGLIAGTVLAWLFIAPVLRRYSMLAGDAITIPQFLSNRFLSRRRGILLVSAVVFMVTYCIYAASSIYACGTLFNTVLGMDPRIAMVTASVVIVAYTFLGGYNAVCWTDFFQGLLMLGALLLVPIIALAVMNSSGFSVPEYSIPENYFNILSGGKADWRSFADIVSGMAWGLGYFGMPHIIIRYISVKNEREMKKSRIIGCIWIFVILFASCAVGLLGRFFFGDALADIKDGNTLVFINMIRDVFHRIGEWSGWTAFCIFAAGILLSAVLAAAMSTADSQLLASSSAFASDMYKPLFRPGASDREMLWAGRFVVLIIAAAAFIIASSPGCKGIMNLVSCAWGAFGAAFGPVIILALYWRRLTYNGAFAGIIAGFVVDALWYWYLADKTGIYEILPGFLAGLIAAVAVSAADKKPDAEVILLFERSRHPVD